MESVEPFAPFGGVAFHDDIQHRMRPFLRVTLFATKKAAVDMLMNGLGELQRAIRQRRNLLGSRWFPALRSDGTAADFIFIRSPPVTYGTRRDFCATGFLHTEE